MTIKIWQSYSCNNSSSFRLVARFADPEVARDAATELTMFFAEHAKQMDAIIDETGGFPDESPEAARALAERYGFRWQEPLGWGDDLLEGNEPAVAAEHGVLVVHHWYCSGFGDVGAYLEARGGVCERHTHTAPSVSVLFRSKSGDNEELDRELAVMFAQASDPPSHGEFRAPWEIRSASYGDVAFFRDAGAVGLYFPMSPYDLPACKQWLADRGVERPSIHLCEYADLARFAAIAKARCTACTGPLEYLDPRIHDIETPQLACKPCGGLYELSTFVPPEPAPK